jgi:predicted lysophospholipase L1 biosynthesis ABC-type transport system permease subunit
LSVLQDPARYDRLTPEGGVNPSAPISVVRVKLSGQLGMDDLSRERVRLVAQRIHDRTGLDVDVTMGSSPSPVTVANPGGEFGRPALDLAQLWSRKGVAAVIVAAIDRKSLILFGLVLGVCALFVAGATGAAVRSRRTELAVLACLGWPRHRLFGLILAEVGALGLVAGLAGAGLALPVGRLLEVDVGIARAALAVPAAVLLAFLAALWPAIRSSRSHPGAAVAPAVSGPKRAARIGGIGRLSLANLRRVPGRAVLGATALGVGVASLVGLAAISAAFDGAVTGTLLGDAVSVQVRTTDYAAAAIAVLLGAFTVADVLYINIRERSGEYALLHATGWEDSALFRLLLTEAAAMATVGALVGGGLAIGAVTAFTGEFPAELAFAALGVSVGAVLFTLAAALIPALALRRIPAARLLAED